MAKRKVLDYKTIDKLCEMQCTGEEIAGVLGIDYDTLNRRLKQDTGKKFTEYYKVKSAAGKASLRRRQYAMSADNPTMAIWLGKQWLGQKDKQEIIHDVTAKKMSDDELEGKIKTLLAKDIEANTNNNDKE